YDAGSGVRSIDDLYALLAFFEARAGQLHGFRFRDPLDFKSCGPNEIPQAEDQRIGTGDGITVTFQLVKTYRDAGGAMQRTIAKPVDGSIAIAVAGMPVAAGDWSADPATGIVTFLPGAVPGPGAAVTAGYEFDVPV